VPIDPIESSSSDESETNERWPEAERIVDFLVHRVSRAINQRRRRFAYWKHHRGKVETRTEEALTSRTLTPMPTALPPVELVQGKGAEHPSNPLRLADLLAPPTVTTATALAPGLALRFDNRSDVSVSEYAASDWSPAHEVLGFPNPPKVRGHEKFFVCPYCFTICPRKMLAVKAWKYV
jgi:hypothetical protein